MNYSMFYVFTKQPFLIWCNIVPEATRPSISRFEPRLNLSILSLELKSYDLIANMAMVLQPIRLTKRIACVVSEYLQINV